MEQEIVELIQKYERDELNCMEFYDNLQKYPTTLRDKVLALYILGGYEE